MGIRCLVVKSDSQTVVDLVTVVIGEEMLELLTVVRGLLSQSWQVLVRHVPLGANSAVDAVTKLAGDRLLGLQLVPLSPPSVKLMGKESIHLSLKTRSKKKNLSKKLTQKMNLKKKKRHIF